MKELSIRATIPLPEDAFDAADVIAAARPAIEAWRQALNGFKGATVTSSFDGQSSRKATPVPKSARKLRAAIPAPAGVAAMPGNSAGTDP
jgi:hypothetical protein